MAMAMSSNLDLLKNIDPEFRHRISPVMDLTGPHVDSLSVDWLERNWNQRNSLG
jgi:hypothetical protein